MSRAARFTSAFALLFACSTLAQTPIPQQLGSAEPLGAGQTSKPAEQVYKDIQVLKGTPADQLMPAMRFMNIALGVQCEHCHLPGSYEAPNSNKTVAREMIQMENELTIGIFDKVQLVTCWTCHRGSTQPPTLPLVVGANATAMPQPEQLRTTVKITGDQVLDKFIQASGGKDALQKIASREEKGTISFGEMKAPISLWMKAPKKRLSIVVAPDGRSYTAYDGHIGWLGSAGRPAHKMAPEETFAAAIDAAVAFPQSLGTTLYGLTLGRPEKLGDREAYVLLIGQRDVPDVKLYFDRESGLLVHQERFVTTPIGRIPTHIDYADYRTQDGAKLPFRWTVGRPDGQFTVQIDQVKTNVPLDDSRFAQPTGVVPATPPPPSR